MNQLEKTITSLEVAEMVGRPHDNVLKDIRRTIQHLGDVKSYESYFIESTYTNTQNKVLPSYKLTKKGCELYSTRMTGEKGTQFAAAYIERFNKMENHIKQNEIDTTQLSPELQMFNQMYKALAKSEIETKEAKEMALRANEKADNISNLVTMTSDEWREKVKAILNKIAMNWNGTEPHKSVRNLSYEQLEKRAGCNLTVRLNNRKERALAQGMTKTYIKKINKLDCIAEEKRLVEIYIQVVKELAIQHKVNINDFKFEDVI